MYTHTPAQTYCFDSFWALERATQSKTHWSQWKKSSSLQWALDPAHTTAMNDRESVINNYGIPHRYRKDKFAPKAGIFFCLCNNEQQCIYPAWKFPRWGRGAKITLQHLISRLLKKPEHIVTLWCQTQRFLSSLFNPHPHWHKGAQLRESPRRLSCKGDTDDRKELVPCQHPPKINK